MTLADQLDALSSPLQARLAARGFDRAKLESWARTVGQGRDARNRLRGLVEAPRPGDVVDAPAPGTAEHDALAAAGREALARGEVALCVLAGGMATRMGGVVKSLVEALPARTFLDVRLAEIDHLRRELGARVPFWLMTSEATDAPIRAALGERLARGEVATFEQCVSLRLTPDGALFVDDRGEPSVHATGHGDLPDALRASGLLTRFVEGGGRVVWIANVDNLGATIDPAILGAHLQSGAPVTVELVDKVGTDRGGVPARHDGRKTIVEEMRLPIGFDPASIRVFNTNTFLVDARALLELDFPFTYIEVEKKVGARSAVQLERLLGEITVPLEPAFLRVPREGERARFLPVKDEIELARRRSEIEAVVRARVPGVL
jgi:UTP--glucose-1-phosphate uridylyltransferase